MNEKELEEAYYHFRREYPYADFENAVCKLVNSAFGNLKGARQALLLTQETVAEKLNVSRSTYKKMEEGDLCGKASVAALKRAAEALGCELVIAIVPQGRKPYSNIIWNLIYKELINSPLLDFHSQKRKPSVLASLVKLKIKKPAVRRRLGWTRRCVTPRGPLGRA